MIKLSKEDLDILSHDFTYSHDYSGLNYLVDRLKELKENKIIIDLIDSYILAYYIHNVEEIISTTTFQEELEAWKHYKKMRKAIMSLYDIEFDKTKEDQQ
jgi:hypothetical protein